MELVEVIKKRSSVRNFSPNPIDDKVIKQIIELGNLAPSAGNLQPRDFVVVKNQEIKTKLADAAHDQDFVAEAPVVIVVCANLGRTSPYGTRGKELYSIQDSAASIQNMLLAVVDFGLASCWVGAFDESAVSKILELPSDVRPVAIIPIGLQEIEYGTTSRMDVNELIHYDKW
jgi:nitroreductase